MSARPPLNALHVFCAVVRCGGFRPAAQVLSLTPGAISRQVQALEARLGQSLFERGPGSATLTADGRRLHERVAGPMEVVAAALESPAAAPARATVRVDTGVTLAMHWLIPRLPAFAARHPHLHVQVRTGDGMIDTAAPVDVFIRRERAELRDLPARVFMTERSVLVAGAAFVAPDASRSARDLRWVARLPRIGARSRPDLWPRWSAFHGLDPAVHEPTLEFDSTVLAIQAAAQGLGACVVPEMFVDGMLATGALRCLHGARVDTGSYAVAVGRRRDSARVAAFTAWLHAQGGGDAPASVR